MTRQSRGRHSIDLPNALMTVGLFALYVLTQCPSVHWLDGGELSTAAFQLASAHPPGEPVYVLFAKAASWLPMGSVAFRIGLLSALCMAVCCPVLRDIHRQLFSALGIEPSTWTTSFELIVSIAPLLSYPLWIQAVRVEVYAPQLLLTLGTLSAMLRAGLLKGKLDARWSSLAALLVGLNFGIQPLLAMLAAGPLALMSVATCKPSEGLELRGDSSTERAAFRKYGWAAMTALRRLPRERANWLAIGAFGLGMSGYLLLWIRSAARPEFGWGRLTDWSSFRDHVLARTFSRNFSPLTEALLSHNLGVVLESFLAAVGPFVLILAFAGLLALIWKRSFSVLVLLLLLLLGNLWSILPQNKVFATNPDFHGYLALSLIVLWCLAGILLLLVTEGLRSHSTLAAPLCVMLTAFFALLPSVLSFPDADRGQDYLPREHGLKALEGLPAGAFVQVSGNNTMFILEYLQAVEGRRPDVQVIPRILMTHDWFRARIKHDESWMVAAAGPAGGFYSLVKPRALRVELRERDLPSAKLLCPSPQPGWGYYDVKSCPSLEGSGPALAIAGLTQRNEAFHGPEALAVGLNARAFLADYYEARGLRARAEKERQALTALAPGMNRSK